MVNLSVEISPDDIQSVLAQDVKRIGEEIVEQLVELAPNKMRDLMSDNPPSSFGEPPAKRTGKLAWSIEGSGDRISMIGYAEYLDPLLGGERLNRPFIFEGLDASLVKIAAPL